MINLKFFNLIIFIIVFVFVQKVNAAKVPVLTDLIAQRTAVLADRIVMMTGNKKLVESITQTGVEKLTFFSAIASKIGTNRTLPFQDYDFNKVGVRVAVPKAGEISPLNLLMHENLIIPESINFDLGGQYSFKRLVEIVTTYFSTSLLEVDGGQDIAGDLRRDVFLFLLHYLIMVPERLMEKSTLKGDSEYLAAVETQAVIAAILKRVTNPYNYVVTEFFITEDLVDKAATERMQAFIETVIESISASVRNGDILTESGLTYREYLSELADIYWNRLFYNFDKTTGVRKFFNKKAFEIAVRDFAHFCNNLGLLEEGIASETMFTNSLGFLRENVSKWRSSQSSTIIRSGHSLLGADFPLGRRYLKF